MSVMSELIRFLPYPPDESLIYVARYSPVWVVVSVLLAMLASYAAMTTSACAENAKKKYSRWTWNVVSSVTLGVGTWAMHFIGMLSLDLPCGIHYDPFVTLLSMIPAILAGGIAFSAGWKNESKHLPPLLASILLGAGIGTMHYAGMAAMHLDGFIRYDPSLFSLSIVTAMVLSYLALKVKNKRSQSGNKEHLLTAVILGSAVSAMHYTAMSATYFIRGNTDTEAVVFNSNVLALLVLITTVILALASLTLASISRNRDMTEQLRESHLQMQLLLNSMAEGAYGVDVNGNCTFANQSMLRILGYATVDEVIGKHIHALIHHSHPDGSPYPSTECNMYRAYRRNEAIHVSDEVFWCKDGHAIPVEYWSQPIVVEGVVQGAIATFMDISQRKLADEQIHRLAFYDALTLLPNRRLLTDRLDHLLATSRRSGSYGALMFLDLDNFKPLNDRYGHKVGDLLLIEVSRRISSCIRAIDTVARFGGDEFVVVINELDMDVTKSTHHASIVAEKIRASLSETYWLASSLGDFSGTVEHRCTASIGVVVFNGDANKDDLLKLADMSMYEAKKAGCNHVVVKLHDAGDSIAMNQSNAILRLTWHQSYCCGEPTVDKAHQKLFDLANTLIEAEFSRSECPQQFDASLDALLSHVVQHFAEEESILAELHYEELEAHVQAHKMLLEQALQLRAKATHGGVDIGELVKFLATDVIAQHLLKTDRKFYTLFSTSKPATI